MTQQVQTTTPFHNLLTECSVWESRSLAEYSKGKAVSFYNMVIKPSQTDLHARTYIHDTCQTQIGTFKDLSSTFEGQHFPLFKEVAFNLRCRPAYTNHALLTMFPRGVALLTIAYLEVDFFENECVALPVITRTSVFTLRVLQSNVSAAAYTPEGLKDAYTPLQSSLIEFVDRQETAEKRFRAGRSVGGAFTVTPARDDIPKVEAITQAKIDFASEILENSTPRALAPTTPEQIEEMFKTQISKGAGAASGTGAAGSKS